MNISSARLTGWWAADDYGVDILLNGNATSNPNPWWNAWLGFTITSGFVQTTNTLSFVVHNSGQAANPTGLRVDNLSLTANAIPEPASFVLLAAGLGVLMALRRRRLV